MAALDYPADQHDTLLKEACQHDLELFNEVNALLKAHAKTDGLLDAFAAEQAADLLKDLDEMPQQIGPYAILGELGEGGMGRVFHAKRDDGQFEQFVAIKVLRPGLATSSIIRRFLHERQILAKLQHPHIARLLDGGIDEHGHPFFAMDHVDGLPITAYCNTHQFSIKQRIQLFLDVCDAVQYAHRNLVVHSDLKPGNILVNTAGDVKLLDFGISRILDNSQEKEKTITAMTALTPEYASPEQINGKSVTTAVDVYTLGIILHELLTGYRPYTFESRSLENIVQKVCKDDHPGMSTLFDQLAEEKQRIVANDRKTDLNALRKTFQGDLNAITGKALQKEPEDRYVSVEALAQDLNRYLTSQPVYAQKDSWWYRAKKYANRQKAGLAIFAVILSSIGFQLVSQKFQADQIVAERDIARQEAIKAEQIGQYLESIFATSNPDVNRGKDVTARELLDAGSARIENELANQPQAQAHMQKILGRVYGQLQLNDESETLLRKSLTQHQQLYGRRDSLVALAHYDLAYTLQKSLSKATEAIEHYSKALDIQQEIHGRQHPKTLNARIALSLLSHRLPLSERPDSLINTTLAMLVNDTTLISHLPAEKQLQVATLFLYNSASDKTEYICKNLIATLDSTNTENQFWLIQSHKTLGDLYMFRNNDTATAHHFKQALSLNTKLNGATHPANLNTKAYIATALGRLKKLDEAIQLQLEVLHDIKRIQGDDSEKAGEASMLTGRIYYWNNEYKKSIAYYRDALAIYQKTGENNRIIPLILKEVSYSLTYTDQLAESEKVLREASVLSEQAYGASNQQTVQINLELGKILIRRDKAIEGVPLAQEALKQRQALFPPEHRYVGEAHLVVGGGLTKLSRFEEAETHLLQSQKIFKAIKSPDTSWQEAAQETLNTLYTAWEKPERISP